MFTDADMMEYRYWGERLAALQAFMRERPPRNGFERWIKWQTSESNAFAMALAVLLISVVVGLSPPCRAGSLGRPGLSLCLPTMRWLHFFRRLPSCFASSRGAKGGGLPNKDKPLQ